MLIVWSLSILIQSTEMMPIIRVRVNSSKWVWRQSLNGRGWLFKVNGCNFFPFKVASKPRF